MLNSLSIYRDSGYKAGQARRRRDEASAQHETNWMQRATTLEQPEVDARTARQAWDDGYREGSGFTPRPAPSYFT